MDLGFEEQPSTALFLNGHVRQFLEFILSREKAYYVPNLRKQSSSSQLFGILSSGGEGICTGYT